MLSYIQQHLQEIYELDINHDVHDFLVTCDDMHDPVLARARNNSREQLLLRQDQDNLHLSLYLHNGILKNLAGEDAGIAVHQDNFEDFCLALEGISHFLYVIWNASYDRSVTMLEMELQAEVDKFIVLSGLPDREINRPDPGLLRQILFETSSYSEGLSAEELQRYRDASNFAEQYCWHLESRYSLRGEQMLLNELRRFYRLGLGGKLRRIHASH